MQNSIQERETISLCIALEALDSFLNFGLLEVLPIVESDSKAEVRFHSQSHRDLFLIRLLDFCYEHNGKELTGIPGSCIGYLDKACKTKTFNSGNNISMLNTATEKIQQWLQEEELIRLWLPTLNQTVAINAPRSLFLSIAGNVAKHNISKLATISRQIQKLLKDANINVLLEYVPLVIDEFSSHLSGDYFLYYCSWLTALMNDVRWGIQAYLAPVYENALHSVPGDRYAYGYRYPANIVNKIPREWFWRLMNNVRTKPFIEQFSVSDNLKKFSRTIL